MADQGKKNIASLLAGYSPSPTRQFYQRMAQAPWNRKEPTKLTTQLRRIGLGLALAAVFIAAFILAVPLVRASLSSFFGLGISPSNNLVQPTGTIDLSTPPPAQPATDTPQPAPSATSSATQPPAEPSATPGAVESQPGGLNLTANPNIQQVTELSGWQAVTPGYLPEGFHFDSAYYDATNKLIMMSFFATEKLAGSDLTATLSLTLVQAKHNDVVPLMAAPGSAIQDVKVGEAPAAYVTGAWDSNFVANASETNGGHMEWNWRSDLPIQNVFWQVGDIYLVLITDATSLSQEELLKTAASIR